MEHNFYVAAFVTWSISLKIPPFLFISTSNVSNPVTSPLFRTKILSQSLIVFKRCAIVITVEDLSSSRTMFQIVCSVSGSTCAVGSSKMTIFFCCNSTRTKQISWRSPTLLYRAPIIYDPTDPPDSLQDFSAAPFLKRAIVPRLQTILHQIKILSQRSNEEGRILPKKGYCPSKFLEVDTTYIDIINQYISTSFRHAHKCRHERRFPCTRAAHNSDLGPSIDVKCDIL